MILVFAPVAWIWNTPWPSVMVLLPVSLTVMEAPVSGSPFMSITRPDKSWPDGLGVVSVAGGITGAGCIGLGLMIMVFFSMVAISGWSFNTAFNAWSSGTFLSSMLTSFACRTSGMS